MFTLKKLAFVSIAALSAFAISCSDDGEDPGGTITGLSFGTASGNTYTFTGSVAGSDGATVESVDLKATNAVFESTGNITVNGGSPTLALNVPLTVTNCQSGATISVKVEVTAKFSSGDPATESKEINHTCAGSSDPTLEKKKVTVGGTGTAGSFVDLDPITPGVFNQAQFAANVAEIDIVYGAGFGGGEKIYSTIGADGKGLTGGTVGDISGKLAEDGGVSMIYTLTSAQQATVKSATKLSQLNDIIQGATADSDYVDAVVGTAFMVFTTDANYRFVVIDTKNTTVSIEITNISGE